MGRFYSFRNVGGSRHSEAQGEISTAAAVDLRNFFEKSFLRIFQKLSAAVVYCFIIIG